MKAIVLCAGKSTRTYPLTVNRPKPLLKVVDKTLIEHILLELKGIVGEVILVIGFMKDEIINFLGNNYQGIKITYVEQKEQLGTGHAVMQCEKHLKDEEKFLVMNGDDLYSKEDIKNLCKLKSGALAKKIENPSAFGVFKINKNNNMINLVEKPKKFIGNLANTGCYLLEPAIFNILKNTKKTQRKEIEITSAILEYGKKSQFTVIEIKGHWLPVAYPWKYLETNIAILNEMKEKNILKNNGKIDDNVVIKGDVYVGKKTIITGPCHIEGPAYIGNNCKIGPFTHIRKDTIIMDNCEIGKTELYDVVIMQGTTSKHASYAAHGVIGENCNIGAGLIMADYRHDAKNHITLINGKKIDTHRRKLGAFIGDNVKTGISTLIYPGRKLWPNTTTLPGEIVKEDKIK